MPIELPRMKPCGIHTALHREHISQVSSKFKNPVDSMFNDTDVEGHLE